jgi:hypothetical protein
MISADWPDSDGMHSRTKRDGSRWPGRIRSATIEKWKTIGANSNNSMATIVE